MADIHLSVQNKESKPNEEPGELRNAPRLALVVPCYNEEAVIGTSHIRLLSIMTDMIGRKEISSESFILYVDDGSSDFTWNLIEKCTEETSFAIGLKLALNVGQQNAIMAGLDFVKGKCDAVVTIDADLQDDINVLPEMVRAYREGCEIVYGVRDSRASDTWLVRTTATSFYKVLSRMGVRTVFNHSDFRLMSGPALNELSRYGERNLYLRGIVPNIGFRSGEVHYDRQERKAGVTKYPFTKRAGLAIDGITSFSIRPVRLVFGIGVIFILISLVIFIYVMIRHFSGETIEGWTSLMLSIWFCTGVLLISLGIIGEYVGKIYIETKHRPRYVVEKITLPCKRSES